MAINKHFSFFLGALTAMAFCVHHISAQELISLSQTEINTLYRTTSRNGVSVHDPSVIHVKGDTYYIMGSHNGFARSTDHMVNWTAVSNNYYGKINADGTTSRCTFADAYSTHAVKRITALVNGQPTEVDFGNFDAKAWAHGDQANWSIDGNMWAPDIIFNPYLNKWCMYMSVNGDNWHSLVVMLASDAITGPYIYQGPVVFSGFINNTVPEISYKKTDLELVIGQQSSLPARYNLGNKWGDTYPNNIDPCTFWDEEGELWIAYGSWSGGIFMLKLDKQTGLRDYTVTYPYTKSGNELKSDPYFGTHIAGGYYVSGEGPYIQHIGDFYYLFLSYGGYAPDGGYEMRIFRSDKPDGPYVDAQGTSAVYSRWEFNVGLGATTNRGMKLMGAYNNWGFMTTGECAQGHNSATVDEQGRAFVIYHTKYNNGTAWHQVRVNQLFLNKQGWLCAAPFQYDGESENNDSIARRCLFTEEQIAGTYDVLIHKYRMDHENYEEVTPIHLTLTESGRISGDLTGSWALTEGTGYIRLTAGGITYNGVVIEQQIDGSNMKAICFTATSTAGVSIWGYKARPQYAIAYTAKQYTVPVKAGQNVNKNLPLHGEGFFGATIEWESSCPDVISNTGLYNPADTATAVVLTCRITAENYVFERDFKVTAQKATELAGDYRTGIVAYYDFNSRPTRNLYDDSQSVIYGRTGQGTAATLEENPDRYSKVVRLYPGEHASTSFARMPNPLLGRETPEGFTISTWVLRSDENLWDALWSFTDKTVSQPAQIQQRMFLTGNGYFGFDDGANTLDLNRPNDAGTNPTAFIPVGEWALVTLTVSPDDGVRLYVNGTRKNQKSITSSADFTTHFFNFITTAQYLNLGAGSPWGTPDALIDDLLVYDRALSAIDVRALSTMANRATDFGPVQVGIANLPAADAPAADAVHDLSGRRTTLRRPGLYIVGGRKVLLK